MSSWFNSEKKIPKWWTGEFKVNEKTVVYLCVLKAKLKHIKILKFIWTTIILNWAAQNNKLLGVFYQ